MLPYAPDPPPRIVLRTSAPNVDGQQMLPIVHCVARGIMHTAPVRATAKVRSSVPAAGRVARIARVVVDFDKRP